MRYSGVLGVRGPAVEDSPGIFVRPITEYTVSGEIFTSPARWSQGETQQDSLTASQVISCIVDTSKVNVFLDVAYATWQGKKWLVKSVTHQPPRMEFTLGGVFNE